MKPNPDQQPESVPDHRRYWLDEKGQPWCADCNPPPAGVAVIEVAASLTEETYEQEERVAIKNE